MTAKNEIEMATRCATTAIDSAQIFHPDGGVWQQSEPAVFSVTAGPAEDSASESFPDGMLPVVSLPRLDGESEAAGLRRRCFFEDMNRFFSPNFSVGIEQNSRPSSGRERTFDDYRGSLTVRLRKFARNGFGGVDREGLDG